MKNTLCYWIKGICFHFLQRIKVVAHFPVLTIVGVIVPNGELGKRNKVGNKILLKISVFFPELLKKLSFFKQLRLISSDIRPIKSEIWFFKHVSSENQTLVYRCFSGGVKKPSECRHGKVRPSSISFFLIYQYSTEESLHFLSDRPFFHH